MEFTIYIAGTKLIADFLGLGVSIVIKLLTVQSRIDITFTSRHFYLERLLRT